MTRLHTLISLLVLAFLTMSGHPEALAKRGESGKATINLDGVPEVVNFNDGDSFRIIKGPRKGQKARLVGYNTLEAYGPVHFWGHGHGWDFYNINKQDIVLAAKGGWECSSLGTADGYGRILVLCPELRKQMILEGYAHVYAYGDEEPDPELIEIQLKAQNERRGMWKYGIPAAIVTSVHSIDERSSDDHLAPERDTSYNRLADTRTGKTFTVEHKQVFKPCDVFCHSGSCMLYVPFDRRYGKDRPACLRGKEGERNRMNGPRHLDEPLAE